MLFVVARSRIDGIFVDTPRFDDAATAEMIVLSGRADPSNRA